MSDFIVLIRGRDRGQSPHQMEQTMKKWSAWFKELAAAGHLKDPGHPLEPACKVISGKKRAVNDGPFVEAKDVVGGYIVLAASDLAHAVELAKGCPVLDADGVVEIRAVERMDM